MHVLVTGSTGFIGSALVSYLIEQGCSVTRLVRRRVTEDDSDVEWDPGAGTIDAKRLAGVDAVVHLAGESIYARRWTARRKAIIRDSRVEGTRLLSQTLAGLDPPPRVLACASGLGYYGDRGDETLREDSGPGSDFLAEATRQWEEATEAATQSGVRVVNLRFGLVFSPTGGALPKMMTPFKLGVGGRLGGGRQYVSWISLDDAMRAIHHALTTETLKGPVNVSAPGAVTNATLAKAIGNALSRPALIPVPGFALRLGLGELAETVLSSNRLEPAKLLESGFVFDHPDLPGALRSMLR